MHAHSWRDRIQGKLDALTRQWWLYPILLLLFFLPSQAAKGFDPRESVDLIGQVLSRPLIFSFPILLPVAKVIPVVLIAGVFLLGNRMRRAFNVYVALLYLALAFLQTTAVTDRYGLAIITGNMALILVVGLVWLWEAIAELNDFSQRRRRLWEWWVAPLALVALLAPVDATTMAPDLHPLGMLCNGAGLTFCMMTPVILAVLAVHSPSVNGAVLRISSCVGLLLGAVNLIMWFVLQPWGWWMGVMHIPLVALSAYGLVLGLHATPPVGAVVR